MYKLNELEQYKRKENIRIHGILESGDNTDNGIVTLLNFAQEINIHLEQNNIQRVHRIVKIRSSKKRPIIVCFCSMKKRNEFMFGKAKLKIN